MIWDQNIFDRLSRFILDKHFQFVVLYSYSAFAWRMNQKYRFFRKLGKFSLKVSLSEMQFHT